VLVGDGLHLLVSDASRMMPSLRERMDAARISYSSVEAVAASLEDVFVNAVEGDEVTHGR